MMVMICIAIRIAYENRGGFPNRQLDFETNHVHSNVLGCSIDDFYVHCNTDSR